MHSNLAAANWIVREDVDRQVEHGRDAECVDRAPRLDILTAVDRDVVATEIGGEWIGDSRRSVAVDVDEIFVGKSCERLSRIKVEVLGCDARRVGTRRDTGGEPAQDPDVEPTLGWRKPGHPSPPLAFRGDAGGA